MRMKNSRIRVIKTQSWLETSPTVYLHWNDAWFTHLMLLSNVCVWYIKPSIDIHTGVRLLCVLRSLNRLSERKKQTIDEVDFVFLIVWWVSFLSLRPVRDSYPMLQICRTKQNQSKQLRSWSSVCVCACERLCAMNSMSELDGIVRISLDRWRQWRKPTIFNKTLIFEYIERILPCIFTEFSLFCSISIFIFRHLQHLAITEFLK